MGAAQRIARGVEVGNFSKPDEVRTFEKGKVELVNIAGSLIGRATLKPGWRWSTCVKPIAKTNSCEAPHLQYQLSGTLEVQMDDGSRYTTRAGDVSMLPPGHDAWVVGEKPVILIDFQGMTTYATTR